MEANEIIEALNGVKIGFLVFKRGIKKQNLEVIDNKFPVESVTFTPHELINFCNLINQIYTRKLNVKK